MIRRLRLLLSVRRAAMLILTLVLAAAITLAVATAGALQPLPESLELTATELARPRVVDRNGVPLNQSFTDEWNLSDTLPLHEIPGFLREAFIHAEDKRFYEHGGPDWWARLAALATNLRHLDSIRGASTMTEQVVRMLHPRPRTVWTRWVEGFEAARLERRFSKDEILSFYLNQVPYGSNRRGVRQAAELYFARDLTTLSDRETLALAVLVRSPSRLDLRRDSDASAGAITRLADTLLERGVLSTARHEAILGGAVELESPSLAVSAPHFIRFVAGQPQLPASAATIRTTLDARLQAKVQALLDTRIASLAQLGVVHGGVLVASNATGEVLAWVNAGGAATGGPEYHIDAVLAPRQPGSALKPLLYALALERGHTLADIVIDAPLTEAVSDGLHRYRNYSERYYGPVTLRDALGNSLNIPAVKLLNEIGTSDYLAHLSALGMTSLNRHPDIYGDGLALGNGEVSLYELVQAHLALARRGRFVPLTVVPDANLAQPGEPIVSAETASLIASVLSDPDARTLEFGRNSVLNLPVQTAIKTGTSSDYRDAWVIGFDSRFTVGVWMGNLDQSPMHGVTGSVGPALLLRSVLAHLNADGDTAPLYLSPKLSRREICQPTPGQESFGCLNRSEWFDPAHPATPGPKDGAREPAPFEPIRLRQPTNGLELAYDPRLPAERQAFRFLLAGVEMGDAVAWTIDGATQIGSGGEHVWPVTRGAHRVGAEITRDGIVIATLDPVEFRVR